MSTMAAGEVYASLTLAGKDSLDRLKTAKEALDEVNRKVDVARSALDACVYDAVQARVPAKFVAEQLGVSLSRVYQIRDEVSRHREYPRKA